MRPKRATLTEIFRQFEAAEFALPRVKMGTTSSFSFNKGTDTYMEHCGALTHFVMGTRRTSRSALVTVTGTVRVMIITATKIDF